MKAAGEHIILNGEHAGEVMRRERLLQDLSQRAIAKQVGTDQATISHWETARKRMFLDNFIKMVNALGYDVMLTPRR